MRGGTGGRVAAALFLLCILTVFPAGPAEARGDRRLFAAVFSVSGSVAGWHTGAFGPFERLPDGSWRHLSLSNVYTFGFGLFEAGADRRYYVAAGNGLHRSTDNGVSWRILTSWTTMEILSVLPDPADAARLLVATPWGVFRSTDAGESWSASGDGMRRWYVKQLVADPRDSRSVFAVAEDDVYRSTDGGTTWTALGGTEGGMPLALVQHPHHPDTVVVAVEDGGLSRSTDNGGSWELLAGTSGVTMYALAWSPDGSSLYAGGWKTGLRKSSDAGKTWTVVWDDPAADVIQAIGIDPENPAHVAVGTDGRGVYESNDGGSQWLHTGLDGGKIKSIVFYP